MRLPSRPPTRRNRAEQERRAIKAQRDAALLEEVREETWERFQRAECLRERLEGTASPPSPEQQSHSTEKE
jgi:hypothetical protein